MELREPVVIPLPDGPECFDTVQELSVFVAQVAGRHATSRLDYRDAKVRLGHVLNQIDEQIPYHERGLVYAHFGLHPKTAQHAKALDKEIGDGFGRINYQKVRDLQDGRAEAVEDGEPLTRAERKLIEDTAETLTTTDMEHLAGVRKFKKPTGIPWVNNGMHSAERPQKERSCVLKQSTPAGDGRDGPLPVAGTPAIPPAFAPLKLAGQAGGASGDQMSFDWDKTQKHAGDLADWCWQRRSELDESRKARIASHLAQAWQEFEDCEAERQLRSRTRMSDKANEIGDLMESGVCKSRSRN